MWLRNVVCGSIEWALKPAHPPADLTSTPPATATNSKSTMASSTHIHNFPNEILEKVFQEATRVRTPPSFKQAPYNISNVCGRWRTIALHPKFWENIVVKDSSVRGVKLFRLFLKHALHQLESRLASVTRTMEEVVAIVKKTGMSWSRLLIFLN